MTKAESTVGKTEKDLEFAEAAKCPTCEQELHDDKHEHLVGELKTTLTESKEYTEKLKGDLAKIQQDVDAIGDWATYQTHITTQWTKRTITKVRCRI